MNKPVPGGGQTLVGISLTNKTSNKDGQSNRDCGQLWQKFETEKYAEAIPGKTGNEIWAVYYGYEGDHTAPFSYFIGCPVAPGVKAPEGMEMLTIPEGNYKMFVAKGKMPDCIANTWKTIWNSPTPRAYRYDFEIYDERSHNWNDAEVDIYISARE